MAYEKQEWLDNIVEHPGRRKLIYNDDGTVNLEKAEGEIIQAGTPFTARRANYMEDGIYRANKTAEDARILASSLAIKMAIMMGAYFGNISGNIYIEDFEDLNDLKIDRGVYDPVQKIIYCENESGERAFVSGFGAAIE